MAMRALLQRQCFACRRHRAAAFLALLFLAACASPSKENTGCDGSTADAHYRCGYFYQNQGDSQAAIRQYNEAIRLNPSYMEAFFNRGNAYRKSQNLDAALRDYTAAIRLQPRFLFAYMNRADLYVALGKSDSALNDLGTALRIDPTFADAYYFRGKIYMHAERLEEAVQDYTEAIRFFTDAANGSQAMTWFDRDWYTAPSPKYPQIRVIDESLADVYYWRSRMYGSLGQSAKADDDLREARRIDPDIDHRKQIPE
jgi:tetratricopeptide (TPR) repeat protein